MFLIPQKLYEIRKTKEKGRGVFAKKDIEVGTVIGDYLGIAKRPKDIDEKTYGLYEMYITDDLSILPNKSSVGIHLTNHSCTPNCHLSIYNYHVLCYASRKIFKGEELTIDYTIGDFEDEDFPCTHACFCGSPFCRGTMHNAKYIEDRWEKMYDKAEKRATVPLEYKFNKPFAPLERYPKNIKDEGIFDIVAELSKPAISYTDSSFPTVKKVRERIRNSGKAIRLTKLQITIWGVLNNFLVVKK